MLFYTSCVRSVMDYAIPAFYNALPLYLKNELLCIEKRSISIITAGDCTVAQDLGIRPILEHYEFLCRKLFKGILDNPSHNLKALLPPIHKPSYNFKNKHQFNMPCLRTSRTMNTFIFAMARKFKCGFPLAEERKKRKTFFSHNAGSLGTGVQGFQVTWLV